MKNQKLLRKIQNCIKYNWILFSIILASHIYWYKYGLYQANEGVKIYALVYIVVSIVGIVGELYCLFYIQKHKKCIRCREVISPKEFLNMKEFECPYCENTDLIQ